MSQPTRTHVDLDVCGVRVNGMKLMTAQYKGKCNRSGQWYTPGTLIAFKHKNQLTDVQKAAIFGTGTVYPLCVIMDDDKSSTEASNSKKMNPSKYQEIIFDKLLNTPKHIFIEALAGCGKTSTLVWLVQELCNRGMLRGQNVLYLAFNKSIQEELTVKLQGTGCPAMTTHSFCFNRLLKPQFKGLSNPNNKNAVDSGKHRKLFHEILAVELYGNLSETSLKKAKKADEYKARGAVCGNRGLVGFIKNWAIIPSWDANMEAYVFSNEQKEKIDTFIDEYEINIPYKDMPDASNGYNATLFERSEIVDWACAVVSASIPRPGEDLSSIHYDDMLYLPLALGMSFPSYNLVLTDESQDFNEAQEQILLKLVAEKGRAVVVGDENQAIYRFRGADSEAFKRIYEGLSLTERGAEKCILPINYRSDTAIIEHAQRWVPTLEGRGVALGQKEGVVTDDKTYSEVLLEVNNDGDKEFAFLCRINVPLVVTAYQLMAQGKKVCIIGRNAIAAPMISIIEDLCGKKNRNGDPIDPEFGGRYTDRLTDRRNDKNVVVEEGLISRLNVFHLSRTARLQEEGHEQEIEALQNNVDCINIMASRVANDSVASVIEEINKLFVEDTDDKGVIKLSTVHRAKGLEFDWVGILRPELMPHPNAKPNEDGSWSEDQQQEQNIQYVAATRAKHELHYVYDWPFGSNKRSKPKQAESKPFVPVTVEPSVLEDPVLEYTAAFTDDNEPF